MKLLAIVTSVLMAVPAVADVVLYTDRPTARMQVVADMYAQAGGDKIQINELKVSDILNKLKTDGVNSPADVVFVKDGVYLQELKNNNLLSPLKSSYIDSNVEANLKDSDNMWSFITYRARTLVYDDSVDVSGINTYADLADPQWAGTLCLRTSQSTYNEGLVSGLIANYGSQKAKEIVQGLLENRAQPIVYKDDTAILKSIANGDCAFGITNSYYLGMLLAQQPGLPVKIKFLKMNTNGVHANGTGAGVAVNSKQKDKATKFIEFMLSEKVQLYLTGEHFDYPAKKGLSPETLVKDFGPVQPDATNWSVIGTKVQDAKQLMLDLGYE